MKRRIIRQRAMLAGVLLLLLTGFHRASRLNASSAGLEVTVRAYCEVTGEQLSMPIWVDGEETGFYTPRTLRGLGGHVRINVPPEDRHGHFVRPYYPPGGGVLVEGEARSDVLFNYTLTPSFSYAPFNSLLRRGEALHLSSLIGVAEETVSLVNITLLGPTTNHLHPPKIIYQNTVRVRGPFLEISIPVLDAPIGNYTLKTCGVTRGVPWEHSEVECTVEPPAVNFPLLDDPPELSYFTVEEIRYAYYRNPFSDGVVVFVGQGWYYSLIGATVIRGPPSVGDRGSASYRLVYDLVMNGFSVVSPSTEWRGVDFPAKVVDYLRSRGVSRFYIVGWSSGGVVAANSIIANPSMYQKAVIADAILTSASKSGLTYLAPRAGQVTIPHYLVWGEADPVASTEEANQWLLNAKPGLARYDTFEYFHDWGGTEAELKVREAIVSFLSGRRLASYSFTFLNSTYTFYTRIGSRLSNVSYDGQQINAYVGASSLGQGGVVDWGYIPHDDIFIIPKSTVRGTVAVTIDGRLDVQSRLENSTHYFFYLDRPGGGYNLKVMGSEPVPEFEPTLPILVSLFIAVIVHTRRRSSPRVE